MTVTIPGAVQNVVDQGGVVYLSHSGGKDSQAMYLLLRDVVPIEQLVVVHADLGEVEWRGVQDHIRGTIAHRLHVVQASKDFFDMVERRYVKDPTRPCWPSPANRQCTSDLKRDPIHKFIRHDMRARGISLAVNATGIRAEESKSRSRKPELKLNGRLSKAGRTVFEWLPVFGLTTAEVFATIAGAGQSPFWAYSENERLSCVFCIMGCRGDLRHGARQRPELARRYIELERRTGWTMFNGESLESRIGKAVE